MLTIMALTFPGEVLKIAKAAMLIAASAESFSCLYFSAERLRFCCAASINSARLKKRKLLNRVMDTGTKLLATIIINKPSDLKGCALQLPNELAT
jgi:hypothetical protein